MSIHGLTAAAIVPVYNRPDAAVEALRSIAGQDARPSKVVIVDDGSTDETPTRIEEWVEQSATGLDVCFIRQPNAGVSAARNRGAREANGIDLLAFLDSDDIWPNDYLSRMIAAFTDQEVVVGASCDRMNVDCVSGRQELRTFPDISGPATARFFIVGPPGTSNTVYRADAFHRVGGFDVDRPCGEDYQLQLRLSLLGAWRYVRGAPVTYRLWSAGRRDAKGQLRKRFDDRRYQLAQILDRFINDEGGADAIPERLWRRRLGRLWYAAGRQLLHLDRADDAGHCFARAVAIDRWHLRSRMRTLTRR